METLRLFVALVPPPVVRAELAGASLTLDGARRVPAENIHLTLRFIGACDPDRRDALAAALAAVRVEPFVLPVGGLGVFPSRGPARVLWAGVGHAHTRLFQLRKQVDEALLGVDLTLDVHHFQPHFTLARLEPGYEGRALARFLEKNAAFEAPPFRVDAFHLLASEARGDSPPEYRLVRSFPLSA
jgi:2'-5' RNA ligase